MAKREHPPSLPRKVADERWLLRFFLAYLNQSVTQDTILGLASSKGTLQVTANYLHTLCMCSARSDADLRGIIKVAPALDAIVVLAYYLPKSVLPEGNIPSQACVLAALEAYHLWVRRNVESPVV